MSKSLKIIALSLALVFASEALSEAGSPRIRYGLQWGYSAETMASTNYTIFNEYGSRISDSNPRHWEYYTNAFVSGDVGLEFLDYLAVTLKVGYRGVAKDYRVMPIELQGSIFPFRYDQSGLFFIGSLGTAMSNWNFEDKMKILSAGIGLRRNMGNKISLDGFLRGNLFICSPLPVDPYEGTIPRDRVLYSSAKYVTIDLGLALYF